MRTMMMVGGLLLCAATAEALPSVEDMRLCAPDIPVELLEKIISHESNGIPWAVGLNSEWLALKKKPGSTREAKELLAVLEAAGLSFDVGASQINSENMRRWGVAPEVALDVCENLKMAQLVYNDCAGRYGSKKEILSCYNTNDPVKGQKNGYVARVLGHAKASVTEAKLKKPVEKTRVTGKNAASSSAESGWVDEGWLEEEWLP